MVDPEQNQQKERSNSEILLIIYTLLEGYNRYKSQIWITEWKITLHMVRRACLTLGPKTFQS